MKIQHNISAINSQRNISTTSGTMSKNLEKLSSGYKINRAGDNAAGLAISEGMRAQITSLNQAKRNTLDGISLVQTVEGALTEVHSMLNRMKGMAVQAANGTYEDSQRAMMNSEMEALKEEMGRIGTSTTFSGVPLFTNGGTKALATGDDRIREKMDLDVQVSKLKMLKANHTSQQYEMQDKALKYYPQKIAETKLLIEALTADLPTVQAHPVKDDAFSMTVMGQTYTERKAAGEAVIKACMLMDDPEKIVDLGEFRGFPMQLRCDGSKFRVTMKQNLTYSAELSDDAVGNVTRINNALESLAERLDAQKARLATLESELENAKEEAGRPFPKEDELREKSARLNQLNRELSRPDKKEDEQEQDSEESPDLEDGKEPAPVVPMPAAAAGYKPSIRQALRNYEPPAPVQSGMERTPRKEAVL